MAKENSLEPGKLVEELLEFAGGGWVVRCKLFLLGVMPLALLCWATALWATGGGHSHGAEFVAALFRLGSFACVGAPAFLFLLHMSIEAERYARWLASKSGP